MKKKVVSLLVAAMTVASLTACGGDAPASTPAPETAPEEKQEAPAPASAESEAPAPAESEAEAPAPAADGGTISVGFAQVGHEYNVVVCQNDNEAYGAMDAMDAAGITYGVDGDVTIISFDATHDGLQYTLDGKITCNVECNPLQAGFAEGVIQKLQAGEAVDAWTLVVDRVFVAPGWWYRRQQVRISRLVP